MPDSRRGLILGATAYILWGTFPLYWTLLEPGGAVEILAHRIVWSLVTMVVILVLWHRGPQLRAVLRDRRTTLLLAGAAVVITINWGGYIWGVTNGRVVETSLGYFINPLVTVLMGVLVLGERLRQLQWVAMGIAFVAVVVLTIDYGRPPWVALVLAFSFGTYGLLKKQANVGAVESITFETLVLAPVAAAYILWLMATSQSNFASHGIGHALLFTTTGIITAIPLMLFGAAAIRVSMVSLGLLQYLAPTIQFALGILVFHEDMPASRWIGFGLVWVALAIFTVEALNHRRRQLQLIAHASAV
ncbi:EamA family transporter RarD [Nocardioides alpinus]|uniref:EamA family transporter RarD n=1 Tax=Nocardioides alpinus TaxID=748909 RepID=A0ABX4R1N6_9ACTN|nr:EamA family transporter RarD [Nocardioides alpinus]PKH43813.1 EamA family transporter RarD [Nocardioides alpinus]